MCQLSELDVFGRYFDEINTSITISLYHFSCRNKLYYIEGSPTIKQEFLFLLLLNDLGCVVWTDVLNNELGLFRI